MGKRAEFYEAQNIFFKVGATIAERFAKENEMQTDNQQSDPSEAGAVEVIRTVQVRPDDNNLSWVPYVQFRKVLQPVLELESGTLTHRTMSDIYHALEIFKQKVNAIELDIAVAEQAVMAIVHSKFDPITKGIWEFQLSSMEPTIEIMGRFLEQRSSMIEGEIGQAVGHSMPTTSAETGARRKQPICIYCKSNAHTIYKCSAGFEGLTIPAKKQFLRREDRCENCLMRHPNEACSGGPCWSCKVQHNSMLCPKNPKKL